MLLFYIGLIVIAGGLGTVAWLIYSEKRESRLAAEPVHPANLETTTQLLSRVGLAEHDSPPTDQASKKKNPLSSLFNKLKKRDEEEGTTVIETPPRMRITKDILQPPSGQPSNIGTSSVRLTPGPDSIPAVPSKIQPDNDSTVESPLKTTIDKLENLLKEKSEALEKTEKSLNAELKNKKEFHKIKDILEKEIKDDKVKYRDIQVQLSSTQMEATGYKNRVNQMELKVTKLEKELLDLEHQIKERDEKLFDRDKQLKELSEKISVKDKLEILKVPAEPPAVEPPTAAVEPPAPASIPAAEPAPEEISPAAQPPTEPLSPAPTPTTLPSEQAAPEQPPNEPASDPKTTSEREGESLKLPPDILQLPEKAPDNPNQDNPNTISEPPPQ